MPNHSAYDENIAHTPSSMLAHPCCTHAPNQSPRRKLIANRLGVNHDRPAIRGTQISHHSTASLLSLQLLLPVLHLLCTYNDLLHVYVYVHVLTTSHHTTKQLGGRNNALGRLERASKQTLSMRLWSIWSCIHTQHSQIAFRHVRASIRFDACVATFPHCQQFVLYWEMQCIEGNNNKLEATPFMQTIYRKWKWY